MILMPVFNSVPEHFIGYMSHFHMLIIFDLDKKRLAYHVKMYHLG